MYRGCEYVGGMDFRIYCDGGFCGCLFMRVMCSFVCSVVLVLIVGVVYVLVLVVVQDIGDELVQLNLVDIDIGGVLCMVVCFIGCQFLVDLCVIGKMMVVFDGLVSCIQVYQLLLGVLCMCGFVVVENGGVSWVVLQVDVKLFGGWVGSGGVGGEIVMCMFVLCYENVVVLVVVLWLMISLDNLIIVNLGNNILVIIDYVDNLECIVWVIVSVDMLVGMDIDVVKLQQGIVVDVVVMVVLLLDVQGVELSQKVVVMVDLCSNSVLLCLSSFGCICLVWQLVEKLDCVQDEFGNLYVVYLCNVQVNQLVGVLCGVVVGQSDVLVMGSNEGIILLLGDVNCFMFIQLLQLQQVKFGGNVLELQWLDLSCCDLIDVGSIGFSQNGILVQVDVVINILLIFVFELVYCNLWWVIDQFDQCCVQVLVESLIVEVNQIDVVELGVQWMLGNGCIFGGIYFGGVIGGSGLNIVVCIMLDVLFKDGLKIGVIDGIINLFGVGQIFNMKVLVIVLQSKGGVNILLMLNLMMLDNEVVSIMVGQIVLFVSGCYVIDGGGGSNNLFQIIVCEDVGLKLWVCLQIFEGGMVKLDIYQEVSSIDVQSVNSVVGIIINKCVLDISVLLDDGQIMVFGGLLEDNVSYGCDVVLGLGRILVLGVLFCSDMCKCFKINLMVFLCLYVVCDFVVGQCLICDCYDYMCNVQVGVQFVQSWVLLVLLVLQLLLQDLVVFGQGNVCDGQGQLLQNISFVVMYLLGEGDVQLVQFVQGLDLVCVSQVVVQVWVLGLQVYVEVMLGGSG